MDGPAGFKKLIIEGITVKSGEKVIYTVCLEVGYIEEVVGLFAAGPEVLSAEPTKPTETFLPRQIDRLPIAPKERSKLMPIPQQPESKQN